MPLQKFKIKPGINRERTSYANEGTWYAGDKIRFRQGLPEKIGGWRRISTNTFLGVCRSLWNWLSLIGQQFIGVGTNLKFYVAQGGAYYDVTPIRATESLTDPFDTTSGSAVVTVTDTAHGAIAGDYVAFSGASAVGGITVDGEYAITSITDADTYTVTHTSAATSTSSGGGSVNAAYQLNTGQAIATPSVGWGAGTFGAGPWGVGVATQKDIRLWSQSNFGEDLVFGPRGDGMYYWDVTNGTSTRAVNVSSLAGASGVPTVQNYILVSDIYRFVFAFGTNELGGSTQDPMLIRWSDQESAVQWTPAATNQAGSIRLSRGTKIVTAKLTRQEILCWTDSAVYSLQYVGVPAIWAVQLIGASSSIISQNAVAHNSGRTYWMGVDKFYVYDGTVKTLNCDLRRYVFSDINKEQSSQVFAGTNEGFNEVWWFYCSAGSTAVDKYVIFNYAQNIWYYGTLARTAWLDLGLREFPVAATYTNNLVEHESGVDDVETGTPAAINAYIESADTDLDDGHKFMFIRRVLPDITFEGSTADAPSVNFTLYPKKASGSGRNDPLSEGGQSTAGTTRSATSPVEEYTDTVYLRVRGRQVAVRVESDALGVQWQLGTPSLDMRPDGRGG
ncbi:MAG TPA: hypothetical protein VKP88_00990 [Candidatus Paceibacterota bacterium]|nr:hypothetical protein [Candidatus Paceibacterota bacterium]